MSINISIKVLLIGKNHSGKTLLRDALSGRDVNIEYKHTKEVTQDFVRLATDYGVFNLSVLEIPYYEHKDNLSDNFHLANAVIITDGNSDYSSRLLHEIKEISPDIKIIHCKIMEYRNYYTGDIDKSEEKRVLINDDRHDTNLTSPFLEVIKHVLSLSNRPKLTSIKSIIVKDKYDRKDVTWTDLADGSAIKTTIKYYSKNPNSI